MSEESTPQQPDNSTIRTMRETIDRKDGELATQREELNAIKSQLESLQNEKQERERGEQSEIERLKGDLEKATGTISELTGKAATAEQLTERFKDLYEKRLESVPEEHRERIAKISGLAPDYPAKLEALEEAFGLIPTTKPVGNFTNPGTPPASSGPTGIPPGKHGKEMSFSEALAAHSANKA